MVTMTIKGNHFLRKNRVTPSVTAPGETNLSDATVRDFADLIAELKLKAT